MTTPTTPEQAKYIASHLLTHDATASLALRSLADQVETLTKDHDEYAACADTMAAAHKVERDALKDAARLALDALERLLVCSDACTCSGREAIAALKAVL